MSGKKCMGPEEKGKHPPKQSNPTFAAQKNQPIYYPNWRNSMQAYYHHGAIPPTQHPYIWGSEHPWIPLYGPSVPHPGYHYPGGVYAQPNMPMIPSPLQPFANCATIASCSENEVVSCLGHSIPVGVAEGTSATGDEHVHPPISSKDDAKASGCVLESNDDEECDLMLDDEEECDLQLDDEKLDEEGDDTAKIDVPNEEKVDDLPVVGRTFSSKHELTEFYRLYAKGVGFGVCIQRSISNTKEGVLKYITIGCTRYGKPRFQGNNLQMKPKPSSKTDCKARINACFKKGMWVINTVELSHNHGLSPNKARFHRCNRNLDAIAKRKLQINDSSGIHPSKNFLTLVHEAGGYENVPFTKKDCRNHINNERRIQLGKGGEALCIYFERMREMNERFYSTMDLDDESRLRNVFWADARCRAAYESFGDVITFDTTYLTNNQYMPFAPFVGVNHHGQSILLGAGLISSEDTETFVWLFETFMKCMNGRAPIAIITDQDPALKNAIAIVWPNTRHRFCLWHIMRNVPTKLASHSKYNCGLRTALQSCVYDSQTSIEFEESWGNLLDTYDLRGNKWLEGLYNERTHWIPAYLKDVFWAGMATTQRSESINHFFDGFLHPGSSLKTFIVEYDNAMKKRVEAEKEADFKSFNSVNQLVSFFCFEKQFQEVYTIAKFKEVQHQLQSKIHCHYTLLTTVGAISTYELIELVDIGHCTKDLRFTVYFNEDECEIQCTCRMFETSGILCKHSLTILSIKNVKELPPKYILDRWRKDVHRKHTLIRTYYDRLGDNIDAQRYENLMGKFTTICSITARTEEDYNAVMHCANLIAKKYCGISQESSTVSHLSQCASTSLNETVVVNEVVKAIKKVFDGPSKKYKGRPQTTRLKPGFEKNTVKSRKDKSKEHTNVKTKGTVKPCNGKNNKLVEQNPQGTQQSEVGSQGMALRLVDEENEPLMS